MPVQVQILGTESLEEILQKLPMKYAKKPLVATFRKGARKFITVLRKNTPKDSGETRKAIKVKVTRGIGITAGFTAAGGRMPAYSKAYFLNYGTLSNRESGHQFQKARKSKTSDWSGGIRAKKFVETSWDQTKSEVENTINKELKTETIKFLNKHKVS